MKKQSATAMMVFLAFVVSQPIAHGLDIKAEILHGQPFTPTTLSFLENSSISLSKIELKGAWEGETEPSDAQALDWFKDLNDDCPLAGLDWTGISVDTTWTDKGDGTHSIKKDLKNKYEKGAWKEQAITDGWMSADSVYSVELQSVAGGVATTLETLTFDPAGGTVDFSKAEYKIKYEGTKNDVSITSAKAETMLKFEGGTKSPVLPAGTEYLRINWMSNGSTFYSADFPVTVIAAADLGLNVTVTADPYPAEGYFSAGDTIGVLVEFTNDGGTLLNWDEAAANGLEKFEFVLSGPKQDYEYIYEKTKVIDKFKVKDNPETGAPFGNPISLILPAELPGVGTYTLLVKAKRVFSSTIEKVVLKDIQVGSADMTQLPVTNCDLCHAGGNELSQHGAVGYEQCLVCHVDQMGEPFSRLAHEKHMTSPDFFLPLGSCSTCHVDDSHDQFTSDAPQVCSSCHNPVPSFPKDHGDFVPLYAEAGVGCNSLNCHSCGDLGVFKTIKESHEILSDVFVGGTLTAKAATAAPVIDGEIDDAWNDAPSVETLEGVELKALYDNDNIYILAQWADGHNLLAGCAEAAESVDKNKWTYADAGWSKSGNEDRFAILWEGSDALGASCAKMCHSGAEHKTSGGNVDVWHWKAARTNPLGLADDKWWNQDGRGSDSKAVGAYSDNKNEAGDGPKYSGPITDGSFIVIPVGGSADSLETNIETSGAYPGYVLNLNAEGSRWDVKAKGKYSDGVWTLELQRALNTGHDDDVVFTHNSSIRFSTATFDNTGGGHASQGIDVGEYTLEIGPTP